MNPWIPALAAVLTVACTVLGNVATSRYYFGKFEGRTIERFKAIDQRLNDLHKTDQDQWKQINNHETRISRREGANGARSTI